ncbi:MAG: putative membrane protein, partial [Rhodothermales bacterium]
SGKPMNDANGRACYRMFIPTAPNPTTGFFQILPCDQVTVSDMTVEQGLKMIVSCGVVVPDEFDFAFPAQHPDSVQSDTKERDQR